MSCHVIVLYSIFQSAFYHVMLCRVRYCRGKSFKSGCPSVYLSVTFRSCNHKFGLVWKYLKYTVVRLGSLLSSFVNIINITQWEHTQISDCSEHNMKCGKMSDGWWLLLTAYITSYTSICQNMWPWMTSKRDSRFFVLDLCEICFHMFCILSLCYCIPSVWPFQLLLKVSTQRLQTLYLPKFTAA